MTTKTELDGLLAAARERIVSLERELSMVRADFATAEAVADGYYDKLASERAAHALTLAELKVTRAARDRYAEEAQRYASERDTARDMMNYFNSNTEQAYGDLVAAKIDLGDAKIEIETLQSELYDLRAENAGLRHTRAEAEDRAHMAECALAGVAPLFAARRPVNTSPYRRKPRASYWRVWGGGSLVDMMNILSAEGVRLHPADIAQLRDFADDWDAMTEAAFNESIPF